MFGLRAKAQLQATQLKLLETRGAVADLAERLATESLQRSNEAGILLDRGDAAGARSQHAVALAYNEAAALALQLAEAI